MKKILFLLLLIPSLVFGQLTISNQTVNGPIGTAAATVDKYNDFKLNQTTTGITLTVPSLTMTTPLQKTVLTFINIGSASVTLSPGGVLQPKGNYASGCNLLWNGSQWSVIGTGSIPTNNIIGTNRKLVTTDTCVFFGNSVTSGGRYTTPLARNLNTYELNKGLGGTTLINSFTTRFSEIPRLTVTNKNNYRYFFMDYGINDCYQELGLPLFATTLRYCIDTIVNRGWAADKIVIIAPNYCSSTTMQARNISGFADSCISIAISKGCQFADAYKYMYNNGAGSLLDPADGVHPTVAGGIVMARGIMSYINGGLETASTLSVEQDAVVGGDVEARAFVFNKDITARSWASAGIKIVSPGVRLTNTTSSGTIALGVTNNWGPDTLYSSTATTYINYFAHNLWPTIAGANTTFSGGGVIRINGASDFTGLASFTTANLSGLVQFQTGSQLSLFNGVNITPGTGTGTKICTSTLSKIAFWNATPIIQPVNTTAIDDVITNIGLRASGGVSNFTTNVVAPKFLLSSLNTAPSGAGDTGTTGEIRIDANFIYICTATNTWKRVAIASW